MKRWDFASMMDAGRNLFASIHRKKRYAHQLERCKQRLMDVLQERKLRLSRKKTRIGAIDKGFHFLGINYLEPQSPDGTNVSQNCKGLQSGFNRKMDFIE